MPTPVTPEISAEIVFLPTSNGGRGGSLLQGEYRGVLKVEEENFSVRFFVHQSGGIAPGQTGVFGIQFLVPQAAIPLFPVGKEFSVWEGRVVGHGKVLAVLQDA
jgi:hypothetical protein